MFLRDILHEIETELKEREVIKDELFDAMRKTTRLSKQAIFSVHKGNLEEARELLKEAGELLAKLREIPQAHQRMVYAGIVSSAFQEYAEAHTFLTIVQGDDFIDPHELDIPSTSYLLGLADVVGELRRRVLDSLRGGEVKAAEENLKVMETIYTELILMDEASRMVSELRRKLDVARRIIEVTRGDVTIETRRNSLESSIKRLMRSIESGEKQGH